MLIQKDRVLYDGCKVHVEFTHKADVTMYSLILETITGEVVNLYVCEEKRIIDFIFDAVVAELNRTDNNVVDMNYIISNASE